tara:strand:+ start:126 stop:593 length:468 start_codon:yes stop_codon:yes gene_type:complete
MTKVEMTKVEYNGKQLDIPKYLLQAIELARSGRDLWYDVAMYTMGELDREQRLNFMFATIMTEVYDKTPKRTNSDEQTYENDLRWFRIAIHSARNLSLKYKADLITELINEDAEFEPNDEDFRYFLGAINIKRTLYNLFKKNWDAVYLRPINRGD